MRPHDEVEVVSLQEGTHHVRAECERHTPVILAPLAHPFVRVRPEEVAQEARVRDVGRSGDLSDLAEVRELRGEAAMHAKYLVVYHGGDWEAVEGVCQGTPQLHAVTALALLRGGGIAGM